MANQMNVSISERPLRILKFYISERKKEKEFRCLKGLKDFEEIGSKLKQNTYTFDDLTNDIKKLVANARKGKRLFILQFQFELVCFQIHIIHCVLCFVAKQQILIK